MFSMTDAEKQLGYSRVPNGGGGGEKNHGLQKV